MSYFFGSDLKYPSSFRFFIRRDTKFQKFINQNCRLNPNEMVDLNNIKIFDLENKSSAIKSKDNFSVSG